MAMIATTGRCRLGGCSAASMSRASFSGIGGGVPTTDAVGKEKNQPMPIARNTAMALRPAHTTYRAFMVLAQRALPHRLTYRLPALRFVRNDIILAKTPMAHAVAIVLPPRLQFHTSPPPH